MRSSYVRQRAAAGEAFDFVVCDPPAFAKSRGEVERAARGYKDINLYALRLVAPGGMLMTFSCSGHMSLDLFQKVIFSAAHDAGRQVSFVRRLTAAPDHPVSLYCPEGEYLKGFLLEVQVSRFFILNSAFCVLHSFSSFSVRNSGAKENEE